MDLQIIIALGGYAIVTLGSYIIIALREGLVSIIKPIKQETIQRMCWLFLILTILWLVTAMALPGITFIFTQNPLSFIFLDVLAPPTAILMCIVREWKKVAKPEIKGIKSFPTFCISFLRGKHL